MVIRTYQPSDCKAILALFYDTVHTVNAADYTREQLDAWADGKEDSKQWNDSLTAHYSLVAEENGRIIALAYDCTISIIPSCTIIWLYPFSPDSLSSAARS